MAKQKAKRKAAAVAAPAPAQPDYVAPRGPRYPFKTVKVRGVLCRATDHKPVADALAEMQAGENK